MRIRFSLSRSRADRASGFTLVEAVFAAGVVGLFMVVCFESILLSRVAHAKAKEEAIAMDFLIHYSEMVKGMPFNEVQAGSPINPLFDGVGGVPNIRIPADASWVSASTTNYQTFHPDLLWLEGRNPQMRVNLSTESVGGLPHTKHLNIAIAWDPPLRRGGRRTCQLDLIRERDL